MGEETIGTTGEEITNTHDIRWAIAGPRSRNTQIPPTPRHHPETHTETGLQDVRPLVRTHGGMVVVVVVVGNGK